MTRLILTIDQARTIQRTGDHQSWAFMLLPERDKPDTRADDARMDIAVTMARKGCEDDQIAEQLGWKPASSPLRQLRRLLRYMDNHL